MIIGLWNDCEENTSSVNTIRELKRDFKINNFKYKETKISDIEDKITNAYLTFGGKTMKCNYTKGEITRVLHRYLSKTFYLNRIVEDDKNTPTNLINFVTDITFQAEVTLIKKIGILVYIGENSYKIWYRRKEYKNIKEAIYAYKEYVRNNK